ncbi:hypothetical protein CDAR_420071 [Caerostris darwini]|uniref:Uncharacterized protein n=1 Tax=Caerostris darwini TaxID=1538125 RepID=A0AAV4SMK1_9ARAC|nr:hypothetical protein CDAR_420071 [Caerostris darwini]
MRKRGGKGGKTPLLLPLSPWKLKKYRLVILSHNIWQQIGDSTSQLFRKQINQPHFLNYYKQKIKNSPWIPILR